MLGARFERTGTAEGSHTPVGVLTLYVDDAVVGTRDEVRTHPGTFGLGGVSASVGRNSGQAVSASYGAPNPLTGATIATVTVDISGTPYLDAEAELAAAFERD